MSLFQSYVKSHWPDTRDVWTDTESDDVSDSGVQSLRSSDSDAGIHDMKTVSFINTPAFDCLPRAFWLVVLRSTQNT
jgi:hypothetical protein